MDQKALSGFALGFILVTCAVVLWNALGQFADWARKRRESHDESADQLDPTQEELLNDLLARLDAVEGRVNQLALRQQQTELEVMDKAEKVAKALADRERKRARREEIPDEDHDEAPNDPGALLQRARNAYPLPQIPLPMGN